MTNPLLRSKDVIAHFEGNHAAVGRAFAATSHGQALSRVAIRKWPEFVPELRARQLIERYPELRELVVDPVTRLSAREMRERLAGEGAAAS